MRQLVYVVSISLLISSNLFAYSGGTGEPNTPYQIANKTDLLYLAAHTGDYSKCFILTADVNMQGQTFIKAIIASDTAQDVPFVGTAFTGTFDGNGHKIINFTINSANNLYLGLFGQINSGSVVKNLGLENFSISGYGYIGGLVGYNNNGKIDNCYSNGSTTGTYRSIGGLIGENNSNYISNCYSIGQTHGHDYVGGLLGYNYKGSIINCWSTSSTSGSNYVGGLIGDSGGNISFCYSTGTVDGTYNVGGLVGYQESGGGISKCYSFCSANGNQSVGGLVGQNFFGSISNCFSTGQTISSSGRNIGGLAGGNSGTINNCYTTGSFCGDIGTQHVGGLVGSNSGSISNCYSTGGGVGGGLVGYNYNVNVFGSFWDVNSSGQATSQGGTGKTTTDMKTLSTFTSAGWDFVGDSNGTNDYWRMCVDGVDYPHLNWESIDGDFACPGGVDTEDISYLAERWLQSNCASSNNDCSGVDLNFDGVVNFKDFAIFAKNWLVGD